MKNRLVKLITLVVATGLISIEANAQKGGHVPQNVQTAFTAKYPGAQLKKWKTSKDTAIAAFMMNNKKYKGFFSMNGNWLGTERTIRHRSNLPLDVRNYLKTSKYASWHVDDMETFRTPTENQFHVYVDNNSGNPSAYENAGSVSNRMLCFDRSGRLVDVVRL